MLCRAALCLLAASALLFADSFRLFLKDGGHHSVREYSVNGDRVRYYSTERGEWEEIPLSLVDLKKTESERAEIAASIKEEAAALAAEDKAERDQRREAARVPAETGVYYIHEGALQLIPAAETVLRTDKKRSILKRVSPIPMVAGKSYLELDGETSSNAVASEKPEFYFRLEREERFTIIKLTPKKAARIVQTWQKVPVSDELIQEHEAIEIFRQQFGDNLYKIWPQQPLAPGEYAVIEYTEGKGNTRVWDFSWRGSSTTKP
ncbi:MAG: hypothetical protein ABI972_09075 [Acidobacteriota bacterium]